MSEPLRPAGALPSVSVVIPTYRRRARLPAVLAPLLADAAAHEVVVVVDGCHDGSFELLTEIAAAEPRLKPVFIENRGEMGARQAGVERASGDVVLVLDDDVVTEQGLVAGHARHHAARRGLVVLGYMPVVLPPPGDVSRSTAELYAREYEAACEGYERDPDSVLHRLWAGNVSLRRSDCLRVGVHSELFTAGYNADRELGLRCLKAGLAGAFDHGLRAGHHYDRSPSGWVRDARESGRGQILIHELHGDVLGPFRRSFEEALPLVGKLAIRVSRHRAGRLALVALLHAAIRIGRSINSSYLQRNALALLGRSEHRRGATELARRRPHTIGRRERRVSAPNEPFAVT